MEDKCQYCTRNGILLGVKVAKKPVWFCVECDRYWYWVRNRRYHAEMFSFLQ